MLITRGKPDDWVVVSGGDACAERHTTRADPPAARVHGRPADPERLSSQTNRASLFRLPGIRRRGLTCARGSQRVCPLRFVH